MTHEEAINNLKFMKGIVLDYNTEKSIDMAIQALELVKLGVVKDCESCKVYCEESLAEKFVDCIVPIESEEEE